MRKTIPLTLALLAISSALHAQRYLNSGTRVKVVPDEIIHVRFDRPLREWHGFGVNYVETAQTRDYSLYQQDYSGFSFVAEENREQIMELIFGEDGLRPGLTKLFLDPFHEGSTREENDNDDPFLINLKAYDHQSTTKWIRYFNREGLHMMKQWGGSFISLTTLYGPAPWMTRQKYVLGRDADPKEKYEIAEYMASWAKYLIEEEGIPVRYISFHNEGDAYYRWPRDGSNPGEDHRDYNMYWPPQQVAEFLKITREVLDANGLQEVGLTPGETQTWYRFDQWGYARAIVDDSLALENLDLITSHSFANLDIPHSVYYGDYRSTGQDLIHGHKPDVPVWVTSRPWSDGPDFVENIRRDIYESKANGIIPWALISGDQEWLGSDGKYKDGSMEKAFAIHRDGSFTVTDSYYYYKQLTRAGQPGMQVADVINYDPALGALAFAAVKPGQNDTFVLVNKSDTSKEVTIHLHGTSHSAFSVFRTRDGEHYKMLQPVRSEDGILNYDCPARSVSTFFSTGQ
jgi:O-glycosyl hydrolase